MKSHAEEYIFSNEERWAFYAAQVIVNHINQPEGVEYRCHEIARVVATFLDAKVVDGKYGLAEHSWVQGKLWHPFHLLDPYAVGRLPMVQLVDSFPSPKLYVAGNAREDIDVKLVNELLYEVGRWAERIQIALEHVGAGAWWDDLEKYRGKPWELQIR